jgi:hypothetical protein
LDRVGKGVKEVGNGLFGGLSGMLGKSCAFLERKGLGIVKKLC